MIHYILCCYPDFNSSASYNRVRLIKEGLLKNNVPATVDLLLIKKYRSRLLSVLETHLFAGIRHTFQLFRILCKVDKNDVVIIYDFINQFWMLRLFGKRTNLIVELTEYPFFERSNERKKIINRYISTFYVKRFLHYLKYASFLITCSSFLDKYYRKYNDEIFIIPLVVDVEEYNSSLANAHYNIGEYIAYCGSFTQNKDGLPILIEAFKIFHESHPKVKLVLIGSGPSKTVDDLKRIIDVYQLTDDVRLTGSLPHEEVRGWISGAKMLALARPNNRQAEGGVPSKVGEYLACGVPSVLTKTGDLPSLLKDGFECFFCEPDSPEAFARGLEECYSSENAQIRNNAKIAANRFSNIYQTKRLIDYLDRKDILKKDI